MSCVWLCPTHIVLCYLSCLSLSCVLCMVVSNTHSVVLFVLFVVVCVLCMVVSNTYCCYLSCLSSSCVLCMAMSNIYSVVLFVLFVVVLCVFCMVVCPVSCAWLCPTHIVLCYLSCLSSSCVLCMVVSNTYSVVLIVLFVFTLCLVLSSPCVLLPPVVCRRTHVCFT